MRRRDVLRGCGATTLVAVAGCASTDAPSDDESATTTTLASTTDASTRSDASTTPGASTDGPTTQTTACPDLESPSTNTATGTTREAASLAARIAADGHFAWFARSAGHWGRQREPFDRRVDCSRWVTEPTAAGGLRVFVQGIDVDVTPQSAGFDLHLGRLGDVDAVRIDSRIVRAGRYSTELALALYLDEDENGEFFEWTTTGDGADRWDGFGGDEEAANTVPITETVVVDDDFNFRLLNRDSAEATLGELKRGEINYYSDDEGRDTGENRGIDGDTSAAIYVGLVDTGQGDPVEVVVDDVTVERL